MLFFSISIPHPLTFREEPLFFTKKRPCNEDRLKTIRNQSEKPVVYGSYSIRCLILSDTEKH